MFERRKDIIKGYLRDAVGLVLQLLKVLDGNYGPPYVSRSFGVLKGLEFLQ